MFNNIFLLMIFSLGIMMVSETQKPICFSCWGVVKHSFFHNDGVILLSSVLFCFITGNILTRVVYCTRMYSIWYGSLVVADGYNAFHILYDVSHMLQTCKQVNKNSNQISVLRFAFCAPHQVTAALNDIVIKSCT